jgi:hypothetical protein
MNHKIQSDGSSLFGKNPSQVQQADALSLACSVFHGSSYFNLRQDFSSIQCLDVLLSRPRRHIINQVEIYKSKCRNYTYVQPWRSLHFH